MGLSFRKLEVEDMKYLFAANKMGAFERLKQGFDPAFTKEQFDSLFFQFVEMNDAFFILEAKVDGRGVIPVGGVTIGGAIGRTGTITNMVWMPWASTKIKLASMASFVLGVRDSGLLFGYGHDEDTIRFWVHLCKYGLMRRIGKVIDIGVNGESAALFQTRSSK